MNKILTYLFVFNCLLSVTWVNAQSPEQCYKLVKAYSDKMNTVTLPADGKVYHFSYEQEIVMWDSIGQEPLTLEVNAYMSNSQLQLYTNEFELFQDNIDAFMVIKSKKLIAWSTSTMEEMRDGKMTEMITAKDTLMNLCVPKTCATVNRNGGPKLKLIIEPKEQYQEALMVNKVTYFYNAEKAIIEEVIIDFEESYEAKKRRTLMKTYDKDDRSQKLSKPVATIIMDKKGNLQNKYKEYHLIDNR